MSKCHFCHQKEHNELFLNDIEHERDKLGIVLRRNFLWSLLFSMPLNEAGDNERQTI